MINEKDKRDREGYKKLVSWKNAKILRKKVYDLTAKFEKRNIDESLK